MNELTDRRRYIPKTRRLFDAITRTNIPRVAEGRNGISAGPRPGRKRLHGAQPGAFVELVSPPAAREPWAVEVELPNGARLRLRG